jgi:rubrerythrin
MVVAKRSPPPSSAPSSEEFGKTSGTFESVRGDANRSLDDYDPQEDTIPPLSVRSSFMELLWICGDCGEHYPRAQACPESCDACGAPKQNFYAHVED